MLAAEAKPQVVRLVHLLLGVRREMRKLGRVIDASDFGRYRDLLADSDRSGKSSTSEPAGSTPVLRKGRI